jgi:gas vesicle protein
MRDNAKIMAAVLAGLAIGAIMGVLFAPEKGSEMRNKLAGGLRRSDMQNQEEEMGDYPEFENEAARNARLKQPAQEKLRETKEKITGNGSHAATNTPRTTGGS